METFKLVRTKQCKECPWKVSSVLSNIPNYCEVQHHSLKSTIAEPGKVGNTVQPMACHHSNGEDSMFCVGWLHNQIGRGNNIALRMTMMLCENGDKIKVTGKQHNTFEDTLPK